MNTDARLAAGPVSPRRQAVAPRTATVGLYVNDTPLQHAITGLAIRGLSVPCWGREHQFMSHTRTERERVVGECADCLVFAECGNEADAHDERFGVWAGIDRTPGRGEL